MHLEIDPRALLENFFLNSGLAGSMTGPLTDTALFLIVILLAWLANVIAKAIILQIVTRIVKRTTTTWDDVFLEQKVFSRLSHLAPAFVIWLLAGWALKDHNKSIAFVQSLSYIYIVLVGMVVMNSFIEAWHKIYNTLPISQHRHIKGYVQLLKIFVIIIAGLVILSVVIRKDISNILTGLGAMAAVLILVFKDTLLGLVASIQLSANQMVKVGDWITIPGRQVDGLVTDITLYTVKIQNFDKTIITVPTYSLVNESFQNWKGMEESGIRQIKRSIVLDMRSIRFLDSELKTKLSKIPALKEYIESKEGRGGVRENGSDLIGDYFSSGLGITNLELFRYYTEIFVKQHPMVDKAQSVMVRHQQPDGYGLPLQVMAFSRNNQFSPYETTQSEIFEHIFAVINEFGLKIFQMPTGDDILKLSGN